MCALQKREKCARGFNGRKPRYCLVLPLGYLFATGLLTTCALFAVWPPRPRRSSPSNRSFWLGFLINELPFVAFYWLLASTLLAFAQGDLDSPIGWTAFALAVITTVGLVVIVRRALQARPVLESAMTTGLGKGWQQTLDARVIALRGRRPPLARILFAPFLFRRGDVERVRDIPYGGAGKRNRLDLYRHRSHPSGAPVLIHFHGGAFRKGRKSRDARPLIYRLASQGWVCISANYRLRPATFPDQLIDVKKVIAWVRENGNAYGVDSAVVFIAGSSAGGHLASLAAFTANDPAFQPGFEHVDTSVVAAISLYAYYGPIESTGPPSSPLARIGPDAPPFFVAHGDLDTIVIVEDARAFVEQLRNRSANPVVYAELPGAQHSFDLFHSLRFEAVVDAIEGFASYVRCSLARV